MGQPRRSPALGVNYTEHKAGPRRPRKGSLLFGAVGGVVGAPFLKIAVDARLKMKAVGMFANETPGSAAGAEPPSATAAGPPGG